MKERLPVEGAKAVYLLDGSLAWAWPARKVCRRPTYTDNPDGDMPILVHVECRLFTRWERITNLTRYAYWKLTWAV